MRLRLRFRRWRTPHDDIVRDHRVGRLDTGPFRRRIAQHDAVVEPQHHVVDQAHAAVAQHDGDAGEPLLAGADQMEIIAEDLGWVPEYVRPHLADLGIAGFRIPHWDVNDYGHPTPGNAFPEHTFATYSTHDHDPINGIWRGCLRVIHQHAEAPTETTAWQSAGAHKTLRVLSEFAGMPIAPDGQCQAFLPYGQPGVLVQDIKLDEATGLVANRYAPNRYLES